ncbi:RuBisCO accumulation factor 1 [Trichocoleus sp. FACHB-262]|uniref:RuBisCO accumulation factor 1 n=1 Tax=Trichocoleus sp. FACHB-262 TaxID=2692869 RepID=UPI00168A1CF7|nr:RuBisCO accumulation factor 1 [Trichocoleus sp. FACHB-262]MBD2122222.1 hypothetical protein [Trichocoleus sp. FACHB-262]
MTETSSNAFNPNFQDPQAALDTDTLLRSLRRKEGPWVKWGQACQQLQKAGFNPQKIFEETGFEPIQQNQVIVGSQVFTSMVNAGVSEATRQHFERKGSDILYEFRILNQAERAAAADFVVEKNIDLDDSHDLAKAMKDLSPRSTPPEGFTKHPGDAIAYQCWKLARQHSDLQDRSRLIAKGLRFVNSVAARQKLEQLLTDFSITSSRSAPRLPIYRLENEEELPRVLPVVGKLPLTLADLQAVPLTEEVGAFRMVQFSGTGAWVPVPGWKVLLGAEDPVVLLCDSNHLPAPLPGQPEEILVVVDRAQRQWNANSYFVVAQDQQLELQWFEEAPSLPLLGQLILVVRPKRIIDEDLTKDAWQIDE